MRDKSILANCKICGGGEAELISGIFSKVNKEYLRCKICSSAYSSMQISIAELSAYYNGYYTEKNLEIPDHIKRSISKTVNTFSPFRTVSNSICDLGYGAGALLEIAQNSGWRCFGSEYSPEAIEIGKVNGWKVHQGDLTAGDLPGPYDVFTIVETLEHVEKPGELISSASSRLRSGGLIYGTTPNAKSLNAFLLGDQWSVFSFPEHPILMSKKGLKSLLVSNGFTEIRIQSQGMNPHDLIRKIKKDMPKRQSLEGNGGDRVKFGYDLVEVFSSNWFLRKFKSLVNIFLSLLDIGDTLVFRAIRK
jgi:SAM-dependent methyltransferase